MFEARRRGGVVAFAPQQTGPLELRLRRLGRVLVLFDDTSPEPDRRRVGTACRVDARRREEQQRADGRRHRGRVLEFVCRYSAVVAGKREKRLTDGYRRVGLEACRESERERELGRRLRASAQQTPRRFEISLIQREPAGGVARVTLGAGRGKRGASTPHVAGSYPAPSDRSREAVARAGRQKAIECLHQSLGFGRSAERG